MTHNHHPRTTSAAGRSVRGQCFWVAATLLAMFVVAANVVGTAADPVNKGSVITADAPLKEDEYIRVGKVVAMLQTDGNFVIYEDGQGALWASGNYGGTPGQRQTYIENGVLKIKTNTQWGGFGASGVVKFTLQDCSLVGIDSSGVVHVTTGTMCRGYDPKAHRFFLKADDVLAPHAHINSREGGCFLAFQNDCNLVLYQVNGPALWASNTGGSCDKGKMILHKDGFLRTYDNNGNLKWEWGFTTTATALYVYECRMLVVDEYENTLYFGGGWCPEGAQGVSYRKYLPNKNVFAGHSTLDSDNRDSQRIDIWLHNRIDGHDKLWTDWVPAGSNHQNHGWLIRVSRTNTPQSDWNKVIWLTHFRTTSLELKTRIILWRYYGGFTHEVLYNEHYYEGWNQKRQRNPAADFCGSLRRQGLIGYLVVVNTQGEEANVIRVMNSWFNSYGWLGANDVANEGHHRWVHGPERNAHPSQGPVFSVGAGCQSGWYCQWNSGEPNNCCAEGEDEDHFNWDTGNWNDIHGSASIAQVCEFGGLGTQTASQGKWYLEPSCDMEKTEAGCESYQICRWNSETTACEENECRQHSGNEIACALDHKCEWESAVPAWT